jgi:hypothetical protein
LTPRIDGSTQAEVFEEQVARKGIRAYERASNRGLEKWHNVELYDL